jgi:hypothetical protein
MLPPLPSSRLFRLRTAQTAPPSVQGDVTDDCSSFCHNIPPSMLTPIDLGTLENRYSEVEAGMKMVLVSTAISALFRA